MISRERAVDLVESLLERERPTGAWARLIPELAVYRIADAVRAAGAMQHLRKQAPRMSLQETKAHLTIVRDGVNRPRNWRA
ncbi:hypothetical protein [Kitasatospora sp. NPDC001683]